MGNFKYTAKSKSGELIHGVVDADDQFEAVAKIKQTCPVIIEIEETTRGEGLTGPMLKRIDDKNLSLMCDRFSMLINVGLPIVDAVSMLARQMEDKNISHILRDIAKDVSMGRSLYSSFASRKGVFPATFLESVKSGEESGDLSRTFARLKDYYERTSKTKDKVISALTYPALTMAVAVVVVIIIMVVAVPMFTKTFAQMGSELPAITKMLMGMSDFLIKYGVYLVMFLGGVIMALRVYARTERGAETFAAITLTIPIIGKVVQLSAASQFAHTMSMMLSSGMPILRCLETSGKGISNYVMRRDILNAIEEVEEGKSLGVCLGKSEYLPSILVEMTAMGEQTGTLETTLEAVGKFYDNEVELSTQRALSVLEPAIIAVLAGMVVFILFSVYLPMFGMYGM